MKKYFLLFVSFCIILWADTFPKTTSLDGDWSYYVQNLTRNTQYKFDGTEPTIQLPKNWYKHGINHGGIVWFERSIKMNELPLASHHLLEFTGVDYLCEVWVNGQYVGEHEGYFQTFSFDISSYLKQGTNTIKVKVNSPLENYPEHYSLHKTLFRGIFSHHDTRPGGAWSAEGQDKNSGGIWNHISIKSYKNYIFSNLKVTPNINEASVDLGIAFSLKRLIQKSHSSFLYYKGTSAPKNKIYVTVSPKNFKGKSFSQVFDIKNKEDFKIHMQLKNAKLWSTHDRGFPHLYTLTLRYGDTQISEDVGFKSFTQDDAHTYVLNGKKLFIKGTNYISSQYMSEMNTEALRKDLMLMKEAHINTIRVHAHIEPKRFYALCDEMGFLVWQDYNLQWGYIDTPAFEKEAIKQAKDMIDMLYNHPSIYIWSMHNEPPWNSDWMKWKYPDYNDTINKELDDTLFNIISKYDDYHLIKKYSSNLEHPWFGWYSKKYTEFSKPSKVATISEYGAQAIPSMSSLKKIIPKKYLLPKGRKAKKNWAYHNYQFDWNEKNGIKLKKTIEELIHDSQTYQAKLLKYATEMLRIQKYNGTTAIFQFMFNEGWPSMNWGIVDYYRKKKAGYKALKDAFSPLLVVAKQTEDMHIEIYVVNDTLEKIDGAILSVSRNTDMKILKDDFKPNIPADSVVKVATLSIEDKTEVLLNLETNKTSVGNHYIFNSQKEHGPFEIMVQKIEQNKLEVFVENNTDNAIDDGALHMTIQSKDGIKISKFDVRLKAKSKQKVTEINFNGKIDVKLSLETDMQLDYKHYIFDNSIIKKEAQQ